VRYYYFDSSSLTKAYALERGSDAVRSILKSARADPPTARALVSALSGLEIASAIRRKRIPQEITRSQADRLLARVDVDFAPEPGP
jgi:predicted nucleic acid-binding protein